MTRREAEWCTPTLQCKQQQQQQQQSSPAGGCGWPGRDGMDGQFWSVVTGRWAWRSRGPVCGFAASGAATGVFLPERQPRPRPCSCDRRSSLTPIGEVGPHLGVGTRDARTLSGLARVVCLCPVSRGNLILDHDAKYAMLTEYLR
jgi:hypothetical protein